MRAVVQRVSGASVTVEGKIVGTIGRGVLALVGVRQDDTESDSEYIADKIATLRIFEDEAGKMNLSLQDVNGEVLLVSQFTLYGDCRKGRRPSFTVSASGEHAKTLYESVSRRIAENGIRVQTGIFGTMMEVHLVNDGPVTLLLDSRREF